MSAKFPRGGGEQDLFLAQSLEAAKIPLYFSSQKIVDETEKRYILDKYIYCRSQS